MNKAKLDLLDQLQEVHTQLLQSNHELRVRCEELEARYRASRYRYTDAVLDAIYNAGLRVMGLADKVLKR